MVFARFAFVVVRRIMHADLLPRCHYCNKMNVCNSFLAAGQFDRCNGNIWPTYAFHWHNENVRLQSAAVDPEGPGPAFLVPIMLGDTLLLYVSGAECL